jgi:hypothetical protein
LPEIKGFSERNIKLMLSFYQEQLNPAEIVQQPAAQILEIWWAGNNLKRH